MIVLTQPGGAGLLKANGKIHAGARCYPTFMGTTESWEWELVVPKDSKTVMDQPKNPFPGFSPDVDGKYTIIFTDSNKKTFKLTVTQGV